jgi:DNA-directed RNA polymerase subunit beta'
MDGGEVIVPIGHRLLGRYLAEDILDPISGKVIFDKSEMIDEALAKQIEEKNLDAAKVRSVLTCNSKIGACGKCYGRDLARGTPVNVGEAVGVLAAQSIGEPGTQLTMRTFHIGGTAQVVDQSFIESSHDGKISIQNPSMATDSNNKIVVTGRSLIVSILDENSIERSQNKVPYGAQLFIKDGESIKRGQRIASWDPYTRPILADVAGKVDFGDLVDGISIDEVLDESTGISQRVVIDWRGSSRGNDLQPSVTLSAIKPKSKSTKGESSDNRKYSLPVKAILSVEKDNEVSAGDVLARVPTDSAKTKDITGGLPRVAELFEARRPKDHAIIAEITGIVEFGTDFKNKRKIRIIPTDENDQISEYMVPKNVHLEVQDGDKIEKGEFILDGNPAPHDILAIKGVEELASYLTTEIQDVYRLQGVTINDKHIEVIVSQMLKKVEVLDPGDSSLLHGEQLDKIDVLELNEQLKDSRKKLIVARPILLGITKAALQTRSFISAASFQETTRVLTEASMNGKSDLLQGLKENVIVGRLIPAGTGSAISKLRQVSVHRDHLILQEKEKTEQLLHDSSEVLSPEVAEAGGDNLASEDVPLEE